MKSLTRAQLEGRKEKAVRFTRDVLGDPGRADEIDAESLEDYAERRKVKLINSFRKRNEVIPSTTKTKADLEAQIADLQDENQDLEDQHYDYVLRKHVIPALGKKSIARRDQR